MADETTLGCFFLISLLHACTSQQAVFEGVLIEPQLNRVFLKLLLRRPCRLDDIKSLDPSVHRSLMLLKKYPGDAAELSLTFSVMRSEFGSQEEVDLIPNGCNIPVTKYAGVAAATIVTSFVLRLLRILPLFSFLSLLRQELFCRYFSLSGAVVYALPLSAAAASLQFAFLLTTCVT